MTSRENRPDAEGAVSFEQMRKDFRAELSSTAYVALGKSGEESGPWIEAEVFDISLGGVRLSFELDDETAKDLPGAACTVKFSIKGEDKVFPGHFAWGAADSPEGEETVRRPFEAGVCFEDLSLDDKADLVSLFMWTKLSQNSQQETGDL